MVMVFFDLHYNQLLSLGCHIGHSKSNTLFYSAWLVFAFRQSTSIINLFKSIVLFRFTFLILSNVIIFNGPIWFVTLDKSIDRYSKFAALNCGEFSVTSKWIKGAISNYPAVFYAYRRLFNKPLVSLSSRNRHKRFSTSNWFFSRFSWPRLLFLSSLYVSYAAAKESLSLNIPCIAITDTNAQSQAASVAIPGNDESLACLVFYNDLLSCFILSRKFNAVSSWYFHTRSSFRVLSFASWLSGQYKLTSNFDLVNLINFKPNVITSYFKGFSTMFSLNYWKSIFKDSLDVFYTDSLFLNASRCFSVFTSRKKKIFAFLNFTFWKSYTTFFGLYKRKFLTALNFKLRFLKKKLVKKFYNFRYLRGRAKPHLNYRRRIVKNLARYYFLIKYNKLKILRPQIKQYSDYWSFVFNVLSQTRSITFVSNKMFGRPIKRPFFFFFFKRRRRRFLRNIYNVKIFYILRSFSQKWKFYVNTFYFDKQLASYSWKWDKDFWVSNHKNCNKYLLGFYYVLPKRNKYFRNSPAFYNGNRFSYLKHKFFNTFKEIGRWSWY